ISTRRLNGYTGGGFGDYASVAREGLIGDDGGKVCPQELRDHLECPIWLVSRDPLYVCSVLGLPAAVQLDHSEERVAICSRRQPGGVRIGPRVDHAVDCD